MFRSICARAIVPVAVAVTGFVVVCCILLYAAIKADMTSSAVQHSTNLADTIIKSTRYAMLRTDRETVRNIVGNIGEQSGVVHVRIFNKKGLVMFSEDPAEVNRYVDKTSAGCVGCHAGPVPSATLGDMQKARTFVNEHRVKVLAITAPIYNEPACSVAACHFHSAEQKVLGTLDIGLDQAPLKKTLSLLGSRMIMFSLMVLILTVGGVSALLSRSVFKPIRTLTDFTERAVNGNLEDTFPQIGGEIEQLAGNFRLLLLRYNEAAGRLRQMRADPGAAPDRQDSPGPPDGPTAKQEAAHGIDTRDSSPGADAGSGASRPRGPEENP